MTSPIWLCPVPLMTTKLYIWILLNVRFAMSQLWIQLNLLLVFFDVHFFVLVPDMLLSWFKSFGMKLLNGFILLGFIFDICFLFIFSWYKSYLFRKKKNCVLKSEKNNETKIKLRMTIKGIKQYSPKLVNNAIMRKSFHS